jgi:hypothetical protein
MLHEHAHSTGGKPRRVLAEPTPEQRRAVLPGHNSIAWIVWHIARGEDWGVNTMLWAPSNCSPATAGTPGWACGGGPSVPG